jgi:hypothetical protein
MSRTLQQICRRAILARLVRCEFNVEECRKSLGVSKNLIYRLLEKSDYLPMSARVVRGAILVELGLAEPVSYPDSIRTKVERAAQRVAGA